MKPICPKCGSEDIQLNSNDYVRCYAKGCVFAQPCGSLKDFAQFFSPASVSGQLNEAQARITELEQNNVYLDRLQADYSLRLNQEKHDHAQTLKRLAEKAEELAELLLWAEENADLSTPAGVIFSNIAVRINAARFTNLKRSNS